MRRGSWTSIRRSPSRPRSRRSRFRMLVSWLCSEYVLLLHRSACHRGIIRVYFSDRGSFVGYFGYPLFSMGEGAVGLLFVSLLDTLIDGLIDYWVYFSIWGFFFGFFVGTPLPFFGGWFCGAGEIRTRILRVSNPSVFSLSYSPE
jgi:hypothetical protein